MSNEKSNPKIKRLPKGQRSHIRRLKEEARAAGTVFKPGAQR